MNNLYRASVPVFARGLAIIAAELSVAANMADDQGFDTDSLVKARLAPDMLTLAGQIQRASDTSKNAVVRLTGLDAPRFPDNEATFGDLQVRIADTVTFLQGVDAFTFEGAAERRVSLSFSKVKAELSGEDYLYQFVLPNFFFHLATAHDILRHKGIPLGKADYLGFN